MSVDDVVLAAALLSWAVRVVLLARRYIHIFQIEEYSARRTLAWVWRRRAFDAWGGGLATAAALLAGCLVEPRWPALAAAAFWGLSSALLAVRWTRNLPRPKKPLVVTPRLRRILAVTVVLMLPFVLLPWLLAAPANRTAWVLAGAAALSWLSPAMAGLANEVLRPVEWLIQQRYLRDARRILADVRPLTIGITGSYGKTSTKHCLAALLATQRRTLATPGSWNTLMGICKVIRAELQRDHEVFVVEMGAYRRGSIRRLTQFTPPQVGIVTCVGVAHLERFGSQQNIAQAKFELVAALPKDGLAVLNGDDPVVRGYKAQTPCRALLFGLHPEQGPLDVWASDVSYHADGRCTWTLSTADGQRLEVSTGLLGRTAVLNILAAATACYGLGLALAPLGAAIRLLKPAAHRLQVLPQPAGFTIVDDAYNSNPLGAEVALEVLARLGPGKKILITPGMVELGALEVSANRTFGLQAATVCDHVILVGPQRTMPIKAGLLEGGLAAERIRVVPHLDAARGIMAEICGLGDVVLFENDLPDNYSET